MVKTLKRTQRFILAFFIVSVWFFACLVFDYALNTSASNPKPQQHKAWTDLESFISNPTVCSQVFKDKKLGSSVISNNALIGLRVGKEWRESGFVIKDLYVLSAEQEISWASSKGERNKIFVKLTLVEKPQNEPLTLSYIMRAQEFSRILSIPAVVGEEFAFDDCKKSDAENFCHEVSSIYGQKPLMKNFRTPASDEKGCGRAGGHKVVCFIPHKGGEIKSCGQNKKALASEGLRSN